MSKKLFDMSRNIPGLSNLKDQINSLINDDDDGFRETSTPVNEESKLPDNNEKVTLTRNLGTSAETSDQVEDSSTSNPLPFIYRNHVVKYSKTLNNFLNEVSFLNTSLEDVVDDIEKYVDENDSLRNEVRILKDSKSDTIHDSTPSEDGINAKGDPGAEIEKRTEFQNTATDQVDDSGLSQEQLHLQVSKTTENKEVQTIEVEASCGSKDDNENDEETQSNRQCVVDTEVMEQIENLIIEMDELSEKLNSIEKAWRKTTEDPNNSLSHEMQTDTLISYTTLAQRRDVLWEKLKMSFVWPMIAKSKNAKISELSVPDSIKEVFQPGFVSHSNENSSQEQPITQREPSPHVLPVAPATVQNVDEQAALSSSTSLTPIPTLLPDARVQLAPPQIENAAVEYSEKSVQTDEDESTAANAAAIVEVDRLRKHLISVEQAYTNELLQCEEEIQILRNELKNKEEKLNSITESYTSMNLSTNKNIEQRQQEVKVLADEKAQLTTQLRICQNDLEKTLTDYHNLRSALDLFYKNKDSEISQVTEKLKNQIRVLQSEKERLQETLNASRNDIDNYQQMFRANEFLRETLKKKEEEANALKMKVDELSQQFECTEKNVFAKAAGSLDSSEANMKLNLIKNIAFRYITSDLSTTKAQSLRILADVLEFSDYEKMKIGIISQQTGEKIKNDQSLIDEFIRFVEKESHPHSNTTQTDTNQQVARKNQITDSTSNLMPAETVTAAATVMTASPSPNLPTHVLTSSSILKDALNSHDDV